MPGTTVPVHNTKEEEKRNLILRLRYGSQGQTNKNQTDESLCIEGQAVTHQPRARNIPNCGAQSPEGKVRHISDNFLKGARIVPCFDVDIKAVDLKIRESIFKNPKVKHNCSIDDSDNSTESRAYGEGEDLAIINKKKPTAHDGGQNLNRLIIVPAGDVCGDGSVKEKASGLMRNEESERVEEKHNGVPSVSSTCTSKDGEELKSPIFDVKLTWKKKDTLSKETIPKLHKDRCSAERHCYSSSIQRKSQAAQLRCKKFSHKHLYEKKSEKMVEVPVLNEVKALPETEKQTDSKVFSFETSSQQLQDAVSSSTTTKTTRKFYEMPASKPWNVCFDFPGITITHVDVKKAIEKMIPDAFISKKVVSMQFENINVKLRTAKRDNRWHIELSDFSTRNRLIKTGLNLPNKQKIQQTSDSKKIDEIPGSRMSKTVHVELRLFDMVMMEEYKLFLRKNAAEEKLQNVILLSAGRGHSLLANML